MNPLDKQPKPGRQLMAMLLFSGLAMGVATSYDEPVSSWLRDHNSALLEQYLAPSIFEIEQVGASDLTIFLIALVLVGYIVACVHELKQWPKLDRDQPLQRKFWYPPFLNTVAQMRWYRPQFGFILVNALCSALLVVQTGKWVMARPRPRQVLSGKYPFTEWFEVGGQFIGDGLYQGSFPSGHTATIIAVLGVGYCLVYCGRTPLAKALGYIFFVYTWCCAIIMAAHRVMTGAHWFSDVVFTIVCGWLITHCLFYWGFRVPDRLQATTDPVRYVQVKPFAELLLGLYLSLFCLGVVILSVSIRTLLIPHTPVLFSLLPIGIGCCYSAFRLVRKTGCFRAPKAAIDQ